MAENPLSAFLRARREVVTPEEMGLPSGPRRRTPGLRRSELAALAGISVEYLTRLEQGRDRNPSAQVLGALADALRLNADERLYLTLAAKNASGDSIVACPTAEPPVQEPRPTLRALLDGLEPAPALLHNRLGDILAHTPAFGRLAGPLGLLDGPRPNLLRFVFTDPRAREVYPDWETVADERLRAVRYETPPLDPHLVGLLEEVAPAAGEVFGKRLAAPPTAAPATGIELIRHPEAGLLRLTYEALASDDQRLLVYQPGDRETAATLDLLTEIGTLRALPPTREAV